MRIKLILRGKRLGLALSEIGELLDLYEIARNERAQLAKFLTLLADRRARLLQQKEDIDAVLAEIDGVERECRRRLKDEAAQRRRRDAGGTRATAAARRHRRDAEIDVYVNVIHNPDLPGSRAIARRRRRLTAMPRSRPGIRRLRGARARELRAAGRDGADRRGAGRSWRPGIARSRSCRAPRSRSSTATFTPGIVGAIVDTAGGYAGFTLFPGGRSVLTVEFKLNLLAPAAGERWSPKASWSSPAARSRSRAARCTRRRDGKRTLVALMQQTLMVMHGKADA